MVILSFIALFGELGRLILFDVDSLALKALRSRYTHQTAH